MTIEGTSAEKYKLGELQRVSVRDVWKTEAQDFTPWLADQLPLLSATIGRTLELEAVEKWVGAFRADILCRDLDSHSWVLIENQFGRTDHSHLGQILTYAAGLDAVTIIWVAEEFRDEHRAALDWLNRTTIEGVNFFGLELELWRIEESLPAPKFNLVCQPNNWTKAVASKSEGISQTAEIQLAFWQAFREYVLAHSAVLKPQKPLPTNWYEFSVGRSGFWIGARMNTKANSLWAAFFMQPPATQMTFEHLHQEQAQIEHELGCSPTWNSAIGKDRQSIEIHLEDADIRQQERWPEYFAWLLNQLLRLHEVFSKRLKTLPISGEALAEDF